MSQFEDVGAQAPHAEDHAAARHEFNALTHRFPGENLTILAHFYRGELARSVAWRQKMDTTLYWAILASTALISVAFTTQSHNTLILPAATFFLVFLLCIEGRRYRHFDVWRTRLRMLEVHLLVPAVAHAHPIVEGNWREMLVRDLVHPSFKLSFWEAVGRRLRQNYIWLFMAVLAAWLFEIQVQREGNMSYLQACAVTRDDGSIAVPGWWVLGLMITLYTGLGVLLFNSRNITTDTGEIRGRDPQRKLWPI